MFPLMGGGFDDLIGNHMQRMNNMMSSFFGNPFANDPFGNAASQGRSRSMSLMPFDNAATGGMLTPFGFPHMNQMMRSMGQVATDPSCQSFSSSSVMTMTTGPDGKPQVYQASQSTRQGPGGVRETKKTLCDSRSGVKKMSIGHHIGERGHVKEKEQNLYTGQLEENDEFINLEEEEEPQFTKEWQQKAQHYKPRNAPHTMIEYHQQPSRYETAEKLALPPAPRYSSRWYLTQTPSVYTSKYPRSLYPSRHKRLPITRSRAESADGNHLKEDSHHQKRKTHRPKPYEKPKERKEKLAE